MIASLLLGCLAARAAEVPTAAPTPPLQLTVDDAFDPPIPSPAFAPGKGPRIAVDDHHQNVVSLSSYLRPVGRFLSRDGYVVLPWSRNVERAALGDVRVLIIANAQAPKGSAAGSSAFTPQEVKSLEQWVRSGGGLLLIADRAPFGGPAQKLANVFGVTLDDNTILTRGADGKPTGELSLSVKTEGDPRHPLFTNVSRVVYVVGESIRGPGSVLRAPKDTYSAPNAEASEGPSAADRSLVLAFAHGKGRVVVIGDAGIASAFGSVGGSSHRGISEADNATFVRNVIRWLAR